MICEHCFVRYSMAQPIMLRDGLVKRVCIGCAAEHGEPAPQHFAEGTQPGPRVTAANENVMRLVEERTAQRDAIAAALAELLRLFRRELAGGYSTAEAQQALRDARAALAECGL